MTIVTWNREASVLTVLMLILLVTLATACSGDTREPETDPSQQQLLDTIERMNGEMDALREEVAELSEAKEIQRPSVGSQQMDREPKKDATAEPTVTPETEMATITTPSGPGICGRSPEVQKRILESLKISLCQAASTPEMFRITGLSEIRMEEARTGDFAGLVNVDALTINAKDVETGAFAGLESLETLSLGIEDEGTIAAGAFKGMPRLKTMELELRRATNGSLEPGAFQGLSSLETLTIRMDRVELEEDTFGAPDLGGMPNLKNISITTWLETKTVASSPFHKLPNLETAEIGIGFLDDDPVGKRFQIPANMFKDNPKLKNIQLGIGVSDGATLKIPEELFENNPSLEEIKMTSVQGKLPENIFGHLENLKGLELSEYRLAGKRHRNEIVLNESSPLFSVITVGGREPEGYRLANDPSS